MKEVLLLPLLLTSLVAPSAPPAAPTDCAEIRVTHYVSTGSPTASGVWPYSGVAAHRSWPFGTLVQVGPYQVTVLDRGGMSNDAWLDLYATPAYPITDGSYCYEILRWGWG